MSDTGTRVTLPVLPIDGVVLPGTVTTLPLGTPDTDAAVATAAGADGRVVLLARLDDRDATIGVVAKVEQSGELPTGHRVAILRALVRAEVAPSDVGSGFADVTLLPDSRPTPRLEASARATRAVLGEVAELRRSRRLPEILRTVGEPGALADAVMAWADTPDTAKRTVLETLDVTERLDLVERWAREELARLQVGEDIRRDVAEGLDKRQREYLLREQLAAIRKELGDDADDPSTDYRQRLVDTPLPDKVRAAVEKEIDRLERTSGQSPEQGWIRTWLDRILELPWGMRTADAHDLPAARTILDTDHDGLTDVKERILEHLAVRKLRAERGLDDDAASPDRPAATARRGQGTILCLVGPPGVGKTSLGESIARAMGRSFVRVALGGVRDEAEIRGHRRTYVGSQPGRIARAITEAGSLNPVLLLDEIDKLSAGGWSGDPAAALLEVLDPAQNHTFRDHYLEIDLDLSDAVFIATANVIDTIPGPLLDRMDVVRLDGYTEAEKVRIARNHLLGRLEERTGLRPGEVIFDDAAIAAIIAGYTREAGVRSLERELARLLRKAATQIATPIATGASVVPITVDPEAVRRFLGRPRVPDDRLDRASTPGVATGLAVTGTGGDVLAIESAAGAGEAGLMLTGQLGDVMKESAQIALSYVRSNAARFGLGPEAFAQRFHVHVPAGAVPKDGPSAGVTMTTALVSLLTGRRVRPEVGMTGEVTLQGRVLPIGGVKQKVLAAHRNGLTEVILPKRNQADVEDVPAEVLAVITVHLVDTVDEVLAIALEATPVDARAALVSV